MASERQRKQGNAASAASATASETTTPAAPAATLPSARPYALRPLLHDVPLSADGKDEDIKINCVEYYDGNLYVGTSASELLHFFRIPPDPADPSGQSTFIFASRPPLYSEPAAGINGARPGVQQILLLPRVGKACVLCNWTVTFYSLPEMSPVFSATQVRNCNWIGGVDLNEGFAAAGDGSSGGVTILLSLNRRIQVVRIGEEDARVLRKIDFSGSTLSVRRDSIACVADSTSYSLLDVDRQLKIPLMSISSLDNSQPDGGFGHAQNVASAPDGGLARSASSATARAPANSQDTLVKSRLTAVRDLSSSLPSLGAGEEGYVLASMTREFEDGLHHGLEIQRFDVNVGEDDAEKWWLEIGDQDPKQSAPNTPIGIRPLLQSEEMLFEDVVERLCQRRFSPFKGQPETPTMSLKSNDSRTALSLQRLSQEKALFERDTESDDEQLPPGWEATRNQEGEDFVRRLAKTSSRLAVWAGDNIWWAVRNPLLTQLDSALEKAAASTQQTAPDGLETRRQLLSLLGTIKDREPTTELEFMTLGYIKQKASVMLLTTFLSSPEPPFADAEMKAMEENLVGGDLDARVVLSLIPALRNEIVVNQRGIWIYGGIKNIVESHISTETDGLGMQGISSLAPNVLQFLRRFLSAWRKKKGFGSIPDEVFRTVDASLLLVLLELDQDTPSGQTGKPGSVRKELYDLVDHGVDCFDRAVDLLETYRRLFVLSRLYQHRKMAADVLGTWRRIIEGEEDRGGELGDGEQRVRSYLSNISNRALVQEYGLWLASRNPKLGVQVFTDEKGKAPKFEHTQIVTLLREEAPDAVKYYLEHLVFGKGNTAYVNELITYYLDIVITDLQTSPASRDNIAASYDTYRALQPPKPTYLRFLADNAPPNDEVWQSRLRLLQLLGGGHDYDAAAIRTGSTTPSPPSPFTLFPRNHPRPTYPTGPPPRPRKSPTASPPPTLINNKNNTSSSPNPFSSPRAAGTTPALLVRLGDYDTAVSYCIRGAAALTPAGTTRRHRRDSGSDLPPTWDEQTVLFRTLLGEFWRCATRTSGSSRRAHCWSGSGVLDVVPEAWGVEVVGGFLVTALRRLVCEGREAAVERALSGAENLRVGFEFVVKVEEGGGVVEGE
ncbi:hypothetical protein NEMBOFW57_005837 [Staphylotrichum longicolle]|uniref:CNH domain-containing protein n=1 Tax=Staphylotrichum longicolle TaxID=669026 RepID=A0AAD4EXI8_9PEZI|nr:hypothetical protein NEMBOFW57_005837 [Staphylotrichum longicolle]